MNEKWEIKKLGDLVSYRSNFITINENDRYNLCRVQTSTKGVILRESKYGYDIKTKSQQICKAGQLIVAELDAKYGGYGIIPPELDGAIVSSHYFLFDIDEQLLDRDYLESYIKTNRFSSQIQAQGSTNYSAVRPSQILNYEIDLPPLYEQKDIAKKINQIKYCTKEIKKLREKQKRDYHNLYFSIFTNITKEYSLRHLKEGIELKQEFITINDEEKYKLCRVQTNALGVILRESKYGYDIKTKKQQICRPNDFIVAELDAKYGGYGIIPPELDGAIVSSHYFLFNINESILNIKYLEYYIRTAFFFDQVQAQGSTNYSAVRPSQILNYEIPLPPLAEQLKMVNLFDQLNISNQLHNELDLGAENLLQSVISNKLKAKEWG